MLWQRLRGNVLAGGQQSRPRDGILQLAQIARPLVLLEDTPHMLVEPGYAARQPAVGFVEKEVGV